jgi:hypothetical protein
MLLSHPFQFVIAAFLRLRLLAWLLMPLASSHVVLETRFHSIVVVTVTLYHSLDCLDILYAFCAEQI